MDLNRSDMSEFQDRELIEAVLQKSEEPCRLNESAGSRLSSLVLHHASLRSTGNLSRPASFVSRRSGTLSQEKLSDILDDDLIEKDKSSSKYEEIKLNLLILLLLCILSLVLGLLSILLIVSLSEDNNAAVSRDSVTHETFVDVNRTYMTVTEVATALSMFVVVCDITCLLVCSLQCLIVVKLLKLNLGDERALKYLKECSSSRDITVSGFFVSIPVFLISLILYVILKFTTAAAITAMVMLIVGSVFCVLSVIQNTYHWRLERSRALKGLPVFDCVLYGKDGKESATGKELSTLV
ncbi:uncharacterized protein LOC132747540 [Ruditapes philippinarum]|uniref:uncharacterized protein LOC132747540 n=1 Tax=Ruditapes philippinarum TaxID=129788 RepID=UPI00295AC96D|nr:uncharacterized protein LOC132747540 [Ruditapes philippinarum]